MDYKKILEDLKKKSKGNTDFIQFEDGETIIRVLPGHPNMEGFFVTVPHHSKGDGKSYVKVRCFEDGCLICPELVELRDSDDKQDKKAYKEQMSKDRYFFSAIVRQEDAAKEKPQVAECGTMLLEELLNLLVNKDYEDMLDPVKGVDVTIKKSGEGMKTEYTATPRRNSSPIISGKPKASAAFIGTDAENTKLQDLTKLADSLMDDPDKALIVWQKGWAGLKDEDTKDTKKESKPATKVAKKPAPAVEAPEEDAAEDETPAITSFPKLKARDPITGDIRYKTDDGPMTADGRKSPKGLAEGERPSKPSKAYLKEFPDPVEEEEEVEEAEEVEEEVEEEVATAKAAVKTTAKKAAIEPDDDDGLEELGDILAQHTQKGKK